MALDGDGNICTQKPRSRSRSRFITCLTDEQTQSTVHNMHVALVALFVCLSVLCSPERIAELDTEFVISIIRIVTAR